MSEAFHQKLLNWFVSILQLLTAIALMLVIFWFVRAPEIEPYYQSTHLASIAPAMGGVLAFYILFFPQVLVWHLLDFCQRGEPSLRIERFLASHMNLVATMGLLQFAAILTVLGLGSWNSCDELPLDALPHSCRIGLQWWLTLMFYGPLLFSLILCIGKAAVTIRSRLAKIQ